MKKYDALIIVVLGCVGAVFLWMFENSAYAKKSDVLTKTRVEIPWKPSEQFRVNEICVNYLCQKGQITASVNDRVFYLSMDGRTIEVLVEKVTIIDNHYFYTFELNRGFLSIGIYDNVVFLYLDKDNIVLHLDKSTLNPNN